MEITIAYTTIYDVKLTVEEVDFSRKFIKITSDNGIIKKKEEFHASILYHLTYYKASGEDEAALVSKLSPTIAHTLSIRERMAHGAFTIENENDYFNEILRFKTKYLLDENLNEICEKEYDPVSGKLISTEKTVFDKNNEFSLGFEYHLDNSLKNVHGPDAYIANGNSLPACEVLHRMPNLFINQPYYQDGTFLP